MAGLSCGEVSMLGWDIIGACVEDFLTIDDTLVPGLSWARLTTFTEPTPPSPLELTEEPQIESQVIVCTGGFFLPIEGRARGRGSPQGEGLTPLFHGVILGEPGRDLRGTPEALVVPVRRGGFQRPLERSLGPAEYRGMMPISVTRPHCPSASWMKSPIWSAWKGAAYKRRTLGAKTSCRFCLANTSST